MPAPVSRSPFRRNLPALKCGACGEQHYATQLSRTEAAMRRVGMVSQEITTRCMYCGARHCLVDERWVRA